MDDVSVFFSRLRLTIDAAEPLVASRLCRSGQSLEITQLINEAQSQVEKIKALSDAAAKHEKEMEKLRQAAATQQVVRQGSLIVDSDEMNALKARINTVEKTVTARDSTIEEMKKMIHNMLLEKKNKGKKGDALLRGATRTSGPLTPKGGGARPPAASDSQGKGGIQCVGVSKMQMEKKEQPPKQLGDNQLEKKKTLHTPGMHMEKKEQPPKQLGAEDATPSETVSESKLGKKKTPQPQRSIKKSAAPPPKARSSSSSSSEPQVTISSDSDDDAKDSLKWGASNWNGSNDWDSDKNLTKSSQSSGWDQSNAWDEGSKWFNNDSQPNERGRWGDGGWDDSCKDTENDQEKWRRRGDKRDRDGGPLPSNPAEILPDAKEKENTVPTKLQTPQKPRRR